LRSHWPLRALRSDESLLLLSLPDESVQSQMGRLVAGALRLQWVEQLLLLDEESLQSQW